MDKLDFTCGLWTPVSLFIAKRTCKHTCAVITSWSKECAVDSTSSSNSWRFTCGPRVKECWSQTLDREMCVRWSVWTVSSDGVFRRVDVLKPSRLRQMRGMLKVQAIWLRTGLTWGLREKKSLVSWANCVKLVGRTLKKLGRYLAGELVQRMERQNPPRCVLALSDSDHAGCLRMRRSTTCNVLRQMPDTLRSWYISWTSRMPRRWQHQASKSRAAMLDTRCLWKRTRRFGRCSCVRTTWLKTGLTWSSRAKKSHGWWANRVKLVGRSSRDWDDTWQECPDLCSEWSDKIPRAAFWRWVTRIMLDASEREDRQHATSWCMATTSWRWFAPHKCPSRSAQAKSSGTLQRTLDALSLAWRTCGEIWDVIWRPTWQVTLLQQVELEREKVSARSDTWRRERCGFRNTSPRRRLCRGGETAQRTRATLERNSLSGVWKLRCSLSLFKAWLAWAGDVVWVRVWWQQIQASYGRAVTGSWMLNDGEWRRDLSWNVLAHVLEGWSEEPSCRPLLLCVSTQSLFQILPCGTHWPIITTCCHLKLGQEKTQSDILCNHCVNTCTAHSMRQLSAMIVRVWFCLFDRWSLLLMTQLHRTSAFVIFIINMLVSVSRTPNPSRNLSLCEKHVLGSLLSSLMFLVCVCVARARDKKELHGLIELSGASFRSSCGCQQVFLAGRLMHVSLILRRCSEACFFQRVVGTTQANGEKLSDETARSSPIGAPVQKKGGLTCLSWPICMFWALCLITRETCRQVERDPQLSPSQVEWFGVLFLIVTCAPEHDQSYFALSFLFHRWWISCKKAITMNPHISSIDAKSFNLTFAPNQAQLNQWKLENMFIQTQALRAQIPDQDHSI